MRLEVERMAYGADAIAHDETGKVVFVNGGVPGDVVEARLTQDGAKFSKAAVLEILEASPSRVTPACPYASACGGCPWAAISYERQLEAKRANVVDALTRIGHFQPDVADALVDPCVDLGRPWGYRNKIELTRGTLKGRAAFGMHAMGDVGIVKVDACPLLDSPAKNLVKSVSGALSYLFGSHEVDISRIGIRSSPRTKELELAIWSTPGPFPRGQFVKVLKDAGKFTSIVRVLEKESNGARRVSGVERLFGAGSWGEKVGREAMRVSAPSFFQVNTPGAEKLVELVMRALDPYEDEVAMDLYCGAGTFTLPLARACEYVVAVESYGPAVRDLRRNLDQAQLHNVEGIGGDAGREFPDEDADVIVVDPPRAGLDASVVEQLSAQPARAIAYVSCDPATLARDLARFVEAGIFSPRYLTPVDLFPQTFHVETVALLTRV